MRDRLQIAAWIVCGIASSCGPRLDDPLQRLAWAAEGARNDAVQVRIDPLPALASCADRTQGTNLPERLVEAIADVRREAKKHTREPRWLDASGVADLLANDPRRAIASLRQATALAPRNAAYWDHLSAALLQASRKYGDPQLLVDALVASDRAFREGDMPSARFNRALILAAFGLRSPAIRTWKGVLASDDAEPWMVEARCRMREGGWRRFTAPDPAALAAAAARNDEHDVAAIVQAAPQETRTATEVIRLNDWARAVVAEDLSESERQLQIARMVGRALRRSSGESLLADAVSAIDDGTPLDRATLAGAHSSYYDGRLLYSRRKVSEAEKLFRVSAARFAAAKSPMELVARYYVASCLYDEERTGQALVVLDEVQSRAAEKYRALHAQVQWLRATIQSREGRLNEALAAARASVALFAALGERNNAITMRGTQAGLHSLLGHRAESWRIRHEIFRDLPDADDALHQSLNIAARTEALAGRWESAYSLLTIALDHHVGVNRRLLASTLVWHALSADRVGTRAPIARDVERAKSVIASISEPSLRRSAVAELTFAEGVLLRADPLQSTAVLTRFIDQSRAQRDPFLLAEAFLARARAYRSVGRSGAAIGDLRDALRWVEARRTDDRDSFGEAYFATARNARRELIDLLDRTGLTDEAFAVFQGRQDQTPATEDVLVLAPVVLSDRLLLLTRHGSRLESTHVAVDESIVRQTVDRLSRCIGEEDRACITASAATLGGWLLEPIRTKLSAARMLVIMPDEIIGAVPFALLPERAGSRAIVERVSTAVASGAVTGMFDERVSNENALVAVGNPMFDHTVFPTLEALPAAAVEAKRVAAMYGPEPPLLGRAATKSEVLRRMASADVVHIATHGVVAPADPQRSCLLLAAGAGESGALYVHEIARLHLPSLRLVVLSGCRTAVPSTTAGAGESIALAFIQSGAHAVVGALWDIEDEVAEHVGVALHRELFAGVAVPEALRRVQARMMRSGDPRLRSARAWAGLRLYVGP